MKSQLEVLSLAAVSCACLVVVCLANQAAPGAAFFESFGPGWTDRWQYTTAKKYQGRFEAVQPEGFQDPALKISTASQHYGLTAVLKQPLHPKDGLVVQYEVKFSEGHTCGGAYLKLLSQPPKDEAINPHKLRSKTPFSIMFGPDRCGPDSRVHVILHINNPATGNITEHHLISAPAPKEDKLSHVYALVLHPNQRFKVLIDGQEEASGQLLTAKFQPPLQPPEEVPDPEDIKPEDWIEEEMMDDPDAEKPEDWDDRRMVSDPHVTKPEGWLDKELPEIPDPTATKPDSWDEAKDGVWLPPPIKNPACQGVPGCGPWKPPLVKNPNYKGPWIPPQVKNPDYEGPWQQRHIPNPEYFTASNPLELLAPIGGVAFELWTTETGYIFDSVLLGSGDQGPAAAAAYMRSVWRHRHTAEVAAMMAEARAGSRPPGLRHLAANVIQDVLDLDMLQGVRPHLGPLVKTTQGYPEVAWVILLLPSAFLGLLILEGMMRGKQARASRGEDEAEEVEQELDVDEEEIKRLSKQAAELQRQRQNSAGGTTAKGAKTADQQQQPQQEEAAGDANVDAPDKSARHGLLHADGAGGGAVGDQQSEGDAAATAQPRRRAASRRA